MNLALPLVTWALMTEWCYDKRTIIKAHSKWFEMHETLITVDQQKSTMMMEKSEKNYSTTKWQIASQQQRKLSSQFWLMMIHINFLIGFFSLTATNSSTELLRQWNWKARNNDRNIFWYFSGFYFGFPFRHFCVQRNGTKHQKSRCRHFISFRFIHSDYVFCFHIFIAHHFWFDLFYHCIVLKRSKAINYAFVSFVFWQFRHSPMSNSIEQINFIKRKFSIHSHSHISSIAFGACASDFL